jgi:hypothetical protein
MDNAETTLYTSKPTGLVVLFGSGEISASAHPVYDWLLRRLSPPIRVAVLETPAGFQPNSAAVAGEVGDFLRNHLRNYQPHIAIVPARKRGTAFSPDDEGIIFPILLANVIFLGPGSPTYAVRQLQDSLAWYTVLARHRQGAALVLASAAVIAAGVEALPVYEIYKAGGEDLHWVPGLDLFGPYGLRLVFVSHWNNTEGGAELDTSHCYMGQARFEQLLTMLPSDMNVVGIDEHTALVIDIAEDNCRVMGKGKVTLLRQRMEQHFVSGQTFAIAELGAFHKIEPRSGIPANIWDRVLAAKADTSAKASSPPSSEVLALVQTREAARAHGEWDTADALRKQIFSLGWLVKDTRDGPQLTPRDD